MTKTLEMILIDSESREQYNPEKTFIAAILRQAWNDSFMRFSDDSGKSKTQEIREAESARLFLTGNYSRELLRDYCLSLDISPNYLIARAMRCYWAKDIKPRYFKGTEL